MQWLVTQTFGLLNLDILLRSKSTLYIPRVEMIPTFEGQPLKTMPFPIKTRLFWVLGIYTSFEWSGTEKTTVL